MSTLLSASTTSIVGATLSASLTDLVPPLADLNAPLSTNTAPGISCLPDASSGATTLTSADSGLLTLVGATNRSLVVDAAAGEPLETLAAILEDGVESGCMTTGTPDVGLATPVKSAIVEAESWLDCGSPPWLRFIYEPSLCVPDAAVRSVSGFTPAADRGRVPVPLGCESRNARMARALRRDESLEPSWIGSLHTSSDTMRSNATGDSGPETDGTACGEPMGSGMTAY